MEKATTCNRDCPDACRILATVEEGRVVRLRGDPDHPITQGSLCFRTSRFLDAQYSPQRLTTPLLRKKDQLVPVGWDEALDFVAEKLRQIRAESGPEAIFHYRSGGSLGLLSKLNEYFFAQFGPVTEKVGDICSGAGDWAQLTDFGEEDSHDLFDLHNARHVLVWGKNVVVSSPHTLPVLKASKAELVLIDPVHHKTVHHVDQFYQPRPGGDFSLAMGVARVLFERGATDPQAEDYCDNLEQFKALAFSKSVAEWCSEADVSVFVAEDLARRLADKPCAILVGWGMGRRINGGAIVRALDALAAISGNLGIAGGGVSFYYKRRGAFDTSFLEATPPPRTIVEPLFGPQILAADPPIRAVWISAGNPVVMLPDSESVAKALRSRELVVVVDSFLTDTAALATVVLPTTTLLEADDLLGAYGHHYLGVASPVVPPPPGVKSDLEILQALAERLEVKGMEGSADAWKAKMVAPKLGPHGITVDSIRTGYVRNPLAPKVLFADRKFKTPSGKVNLLYQDAVPVPATDPEFPFFLLSVSTKDSQSSQWAVPQTGPAPVMVHPDATDLEDGALAQLESAIGRLTVRVRHDPLQRRDVVLMAKGGHHSLGRAANLLIEAKLTDFGGGAALYDQRVRLRKP